MLAAVWLLTATVDATPDATVRDGDEGGPDPARTTSTP